MTADCLIDTNVLVYAVDASPANTSKKRAAVKLIESTDFGLVTEGIRNSVKFRLSYWDGAIIAAAERLKARMLFTENVSHGQQFGAVTIVNPVIA
jgi:predicted nucleic acid-binding protein